MSPSHSEITHVSDTALMVAACRALEAESSDGFVHDPFAGRLAGERGMAILRASPQPEMMRFGIAVRSRFLDQLLLEALANHPIATVINIGCGLDARPWRLDLPSELRWIEANFAEMLDYKDSVLAGETPRCRRERITADVSDPARRRAIYAAAGSGPAMMITEGLLMYLPAAAVEGIATESGQESGIAHWISDIATRAFEEAIKLDSMQSVRHVQAPDCLNGDQILETIRADGWVTAAKRSYITDMAFALPRIQRLMGSRPAGPPPVASDDPTGVHHFILPS